MTEGSGSGGNVPDWLSQAAASRPAHQKPRAGKSGWPLHRPTAAAASASANPISWMSEMKRSASMYLEDENVKLCKKQAAAATVPGGWLTMGSLGAPDALDEDKALEETRAASSLAR